MNPRAAIAVALAVVAARSQQPAGEPAWLELANGHRLRTVAIAGATGQAIALVWPHGDVLCGDRSPALRRARAVAVAACRQALVDAALPDLHTTVEMADDFALFGVVLPRADERTTTAWLTALLAPADPTRDADLLLRTAARTALALDDAAWLYLGGVLSARARAALLPGGGGTPAGVATDAAATDLLRQRAAELAAALSVPPGGPLTVAVVGASDGVRGLTAALNGLRVAPRDPADDATFARGTGGDGVATRSVREPTALLPHPRVDAAFVAAAVPAPTPSAASLPLCVGLAVLRQRAEASFRGYRGREALAGAAFVSYDLLHGDPVVLLCRRGPDGADAGVPRRELEGLLAGLRATPPDAREIATTARVLAAEWAVPPWPAATVQVLRELPAALGARARVLALLGWWRIDDTPVRSLGSVTSEAVDAALRAALDPARIWWGGVVPTADRSLGG